MTPIKSIRPATGEDKIRGKGRYQLIYIEAAQKIAEILKTEESAVAEIDLKGDETALRYRRGIAKALEREGKPVRT